MPITPETAAAWRGFNLCSMFLPPGDHRFRDMFPWEPAGFRELDFAWISHWGFTCVRLPLNWRIWSSYQSPDRQDERQIEKIDRALAYARRYGLHTLLNLHEAPGYGICAPSIPSGFDLWSDQAALDAFVAQWSFFARRYRGIPATALSFNLLNEPANCSAEAHARVMRATVAAIRAIDPGRPIALDGRECGNLAARDLDDLGLIHCCRGYLPTEVSHHHAWWLHTDNPPLSWPMHLTTWKEVVGKESLRNCLRDQGYLALRRAGSPVVCGEFGAYNETPHDVAVAWMSDLMAVLREEGIGFLMWNFRGAVGILDSNRADVDYEEWYGHRLDRRLLEAMRGA